MLTPEDWKYHELQWESPKISTLKFIEFISEKVDEGCTVLGLGTGAGAALNFIAGRFPSAKFVGVDREINLIEFARRRNRLENCSYLVGDITSVSNICDSVEGIISLQTLSRLPFNSINP